MAADRRDGHDRQKGSDGLSTGLFDGFENGRIESSRRKVNQENLTLLLTLISSSPDETIKQSKDGLLAKQLERDISVVMRKRLLEGYSMNVTHAVYLLLCVTDFLLTV